MSAALLLDVDNLYRSLGKRYQRRLDYAQYLDYLARKFGEPISIKIAFGSQKPKDARSFINLLKMLGFTTKFEEGVDWDVPMTLAGIRIADKVNVVIIGSNHKSLVPLVEELQGKGLRTFICASSIHPALKNVSEYHEIDESLLINTPEAAPLEAPTATE